MVYSVPSVPCFPRERSSRVSTEPADSVKPNPQGGAAGGAFSAYRNPEDTQQTLRAAYQYILDEWELQGDSETLSIGEVHLATLAISLVPLRTPVPDARTCNRRGCYFSLQRHTPAAVRRITIGRVLRHPHTLVPR